MKASIKPEPGERWSRAAERALVNALARFAEYETWLFAEGAHGGDALIQEPSGRLTLVEVRSWITSRGACAPVFDVEKGWRVQRRTMVRENADRLVVVYAQIDVASSTVTFRAMGGEIFESLARRNSAVYLAEGGPHGRHRPPRFPVMFEEMDPMPEWFERLGEGDAA